MNHGLEEFLPLDRIVDLGELLRKVCPPAMTTFLWDFRYLCWNLTLIELPVNALGQYLQTDGCHSQNYLA